MNQHLTSEQISNWLAGERTPQQESHLRECPVCAGEVARIQTTLQSFGATVDRLSEQQMRGAPQSVRQLAAVRPQTTRPLRWALAVAALSIAVGLPFYERTMNERHRQEMAKADAALLEQIDAEVSRAVPAPMEPLIDLVAWDSTNSRGGSTTR